MKWEEREREREGGRSCGEGSAGPIDISLGKGGKEGIESDTETGKMRKTQK